MTNFKNDNYKAVAMAIRAVGHEFRAQIIETLKEAGKMTVTELYNKFQCEQSVMSQHLEILRRAGVVTVERNGRFIHYAANVVYLEKLDAYILLFPKAEAVEKGGKNRI